MADFQMNVNYAKPQVTSLGELVNMAGGIQNYQQAQQMNPLALEKAQIENQVLKQKNIEIPQEHIINSSVPCPETK